MPKFKKATFKIMRRWRDHKPGLTPDTVNGFTLGLLGFHKVDGGYSISHLPSGYSIFRAYTLREARAIIEALQGFDWKVERNKIPKGMAKAVNKKIVSIISALDRRAA